MDCRPGVDMAGHIIDPFGFRATNKGQRPTTALAQDDNDAALARLVTGKASINPLILAICVGVGALCYGAVLLLLRNYFWEDLRGEFGRMFGKNRPATAGA